MSEPESCFSCRFLAGQECRRHAPIYPNGARFSDAKWPYISYPPDTWCGDWEPKRNNEEEKP